MANFRQKELAKQIIQNVKTGNKKTAKELLVTSGYSKITSSSSQHVILRGKGVQQELKELGFDEDSAKQVVKEIMIDKRVSPNDRLRATDQVFKVQGSYAPEQHKNLNVNVSLTDLLKQVKNES